MVNKKSVFWFLGLTFDLTWLLDLVISLLILRDPIWRVQGGSLLSPKPVPGETA